MTRENLQAQVPADLAARVRGSVVGMQALFGAGYTLTQFLADAAEAHCEHLEQQHHGGVPWPPLRRGELPRGARLGQARTGPEREGGEVP